MDIRNWPLEKIMQLPEWCYGRRWPVGLTVHAEAGVADWDIAELSLPEKCVLWEVVVFSPGILTGADSFRLALGDTVPTTVAEMDGLPPLLHGLGTQGAEPRHMSFIGYAVNAIRTLRMPIESMNRCPIMELQPAPAATGDLSLVLVFSSVPKEVPDWLVLGQGQNL